MSNLNERHCAHCDTVFSLIYTNKKGHKWKLDTTHCSKSCAAKSQARSNKGCIKPDLGKELLKDKAVSFIRAKQEYCTKDEICNGIGHSSKTFWKHGLKISELNEEAGFQPTKSKFQSKVGEFLQDKFVTVETEKSFDGLVGVKGHSLRVDFYIPEINTVVEADGTQHSDPKHPWKEWNNGTVAGYDSLKDRFFEERNITLVRIPYKRNIKKDDVLSRLD